MVQEDWMGTQGISQLLFIRFTPEFLSLVPQELSWSQYQNCKRIGLVQLLTMILKSFISISSLQPGATRCHGTRIARGVPLPVYMNLDLYSGFWCTSHCVVF